MKLLLRGLDVQQLNSVMRLTEELFAAYPNTIGGVWSQKQFEDDIAKNQILGIFCKNQKLLGFISFFVHSEGCDILKLALDQGWRGKGIMCSALQEFFVLRACRRYFVEVHFENLGAQGLYLHLGFRKIGYRKNFYGLNQHAYLLARSS